MHITEKEMSSTIAANHNCTEFRAGTFRQAGLFRSTSRTMAGEG